MLLYTLPCGCFCDPTLAHNLYYLCVYTLVFRVTDNKTLRYFEPELLCNKG